MKRDIGFVCTTIFHYKHFERIAACFGERAVFIIATPRYTNHRHEKMEAYFVEHGVSYCYAESVIAGECKLEAIVAPYFMPLFNFISPDMLRVRVLYGYAKDAWNYAEWNRGFDLILAYGPYSQRKLEDFAPTVSIGHPRFKGLYERDEAFDIEGHALSAWLQGSNRKTLLYCPTWGDLSSFDWFKAAVGLLARDYNVIIKLHHGISLSKDFAMDGLDLNRLFVCDETTDLFDLFPLVDLAISDYSGAIFDAMLALKKIVLVNSLQESVADTGVLNIKKMSNIAGLMDTPQEPSLDIRMRDVLPSANTPSELLKIVGQAIEQPPVDYRELNADLYSHQDERAAQRAHEAIQVAMAGRSVPARVSAASYISFQPEQLEQFVARNRDRSFVVWGAGDYGQLIVSWLVHQSKPVLAVIDSNPEKQGKLLQGIPIRSPDDIRFDGQISLIVGFAAQSLQALLPGADIAEEHVVIPFH